MLKSSVRLKKYKLCGSITFRTENVKFSGYYFYLNTDIWGGFQICISVALTNFTRKHLRRVFFLIKLHVLRPKM